MLQEAQSFQTPDGTVLTRLPNGDWKTVLHNGVLTVIFGEINPESMSEYDALTLGALQWEAGLQEIKNTMKTGAKVRLVDNWFAWGGAEKTDNDTIIFHLGHLSI